MYKVKPFVDDDEDYTIKLSRKQRPRAKALNETLLSRPSGRMSSPKDHSRRREKQDLRQLLDKDFD